MGSVVYFFLLITCTTVVEVGPKGITYNAVYAVPSAFRLTRTFMKIVATKHHALCFYKDTKVLS